VGYADHWVVLGSTYGLGHLTLYITLALQEKNAYPAKTAQNMLCAIPESVKLLRLTALCTATQNRVLYALSAIDIVGNVGVAMTNLFRNLGPSRPQRLLSEGAGLQHDPAPPEHA
jgi:hypothetical protein